MAEELYKVWGRTVKINDTKRVSVSATFRATEGEFGTEVEKAVAAILGISQDEVMFSVGSSPIFETGGICEVFVEKGAMPSNLEPLAKAVEGVFQARFPEGGACHVTFLAKPS